jgi:hypothetical protein
MEVPEDIVERIRALCLALPEVTVRVDGSATKARSTAQSFDTRRRQFCLLVARGGFGWQGGRSAARVACRPDERQALPSTATRYSPRELRT